MWIDRRWLGVAIGGSLLLNLMLVGIVAGRSFAPRRTGIIHEPRPGVFVVPVRALSADQRRIFKAAMAPRREAIRSARARHERARQALVADIAAPVLDPAKVASDFAALRQASVAFQSTLDDALVNALQKLSPAGRANLVADLGDAKR